MYLNFCLRLYWFKFYNLQFVNFSLLRGENNMVEQIFFPTKIFLKFSTMLFSPQSTQINLIFELSIDFYLQFIVNMLQLFHIKMTQLHAFNRIPKVPYWSNSKKHRFQFIHNRKITKYKKPEMTKEKKYRTKYPFFCKCVKQFYNQNLLMFFCLFARMAFIGHWLPASHTVC